MARGTKNENCPINGVITTESECVIAAAELGLTYYNHATNNRRPAGCYTWLDGDMLHGSRATYFNKITETLATSPQLDTAGICRAGSISHLGVGLGICLGMIRYCKVTIFHWIMHLSDLFLHRYVPLWSL